MDQPNTSLDVAPVAILEPAGEPQRDFYSFEEIAEFMKAEREAWYAIRPRMRDMLRLEWAKPIDDMFTTIDRLEQMAIMHETEPATASIPILLNKKKNRIVLSTSVTGRAVLAIAKDDLLAAAVLLALATTDAAGMMVATNSTTMQVPLVPAFRAFLFREMMQAGVPDASHLAGAMEGLLREGRERVEAISKQATEIAAAARKHAQAIYDEEQMFQQRLGEAEAKADQTINAIETLYNEKIKLHATVTYWSTIAAKARRAGWWHFGAFIVVGLVTVACAVGGLWALLTAGSLTLLKDVSFVATALITLPAVVMLWVLKHLARGYIDARRTAADAQHRATLVETYLALTKEGLSDDKGASPELQEKVRLLMLGAIFTNPGPGNDSDSLPATVLEAISKSK